MNLVKRLWLTAVLGAVCAVAVFGQTNVANLDAAIQQASSDINLKITAPKVALVSVNSPANELSAYVLRELAVAVEKARISTLIARQNVDRALSSASLNSAGDVSDANARQIGRSVGADFAVTGSLVQVGNNYRFRTRLINVATGAVQSTTDFNIRDSQQIVRLLPAPAPAPAAAPAPAPAPTPAAAPAPAATPAPAPAPAAAPAPAPAAAPAAAPTAATVYRLGERGPAGGLIFYDKGNDSGGWRYLEAAPADMDRLLKAATESINVRNTTDRIVGRGKSNTAAIMSEALNKGGGFGWAAQACTALTVNGFNDWFLPSRDELNWMYGNLFQKGLGDFRGRWYWSSTADNGSYWFAVNFDNGQHDNRHMGNEYAVRPIRQF